MCYSNSKHFFSRRNKEYKRKQRKGYISMITCKLPELLGRHRMKIKELSEISGVSYGILLRLYNDETQEVKYKVVSRLCEVLDCNIEDLLEYRTGNADQRELPNLRG